MCVCPAANGKLIDTLWRLCVGYDNGGLLLTAGRTIKLWNLKDYSMVKVGGASYHRVVSL